MQKPKQGAKTVPVQKYPRPSTSVALSSSMKTHGRNVARAMYQKSAGRGR